MNKIKIYIIFTLLIFPIIVLNTSCGNKEKEVHSAATKFLDAYFGVDYIKAAGYCTPELGEELKVSLKSIESLEKGLKEMIIKQTSGIKFEIKKVDKTYIKDSLIVVYEVKLPGYPDGSDNRLSLVKLNNEWKVATIGK
ncbi:MAG: hypothetical protein AB9922_06905 [Bacteroidales bacterium]